MEEIEALKKLVGASPAAPVEVAAPVASIPGELLKEIDAMRGAISKTAAVASYAANEVGGLKALVAQLSAKIDALACKCAAPATAEE